MLLVTFVRWALTAALLAQVYRETGWATTLTLGLIALDAEAEACGLRRKANRS